MLISVTLEEKLSRKKIVWAQKNDDDSFICPRCQEGIVTILYKDGIPKGGLRCNKCKTKYTVNLSM